jgi:hypothetical protein
MAKATLRSPTNNDVISIGDVLDGVTPNLPAGFDESSADEDIVEEELMDIDRVKLQCGEAPESAMLTILKVYEVRKKEAWLFDCAVSEFRMERLERYGSGQYRITGIWPKGMNRRGYFMNRLIHIQVDEKAKPAESNNSDVLVAIQAMGESLKAGFLGLVGAMQANVVKPESETSWLQKMAMYKELFATAPQQQHDPLQSLDKLLDVKLKLDSLGGGGVGESSIMPTLLSMAKPIVEGIAEQQRIQKTVLSTQM